MTNAPSPVDIGIVRDLLRSVCEEMGIVLQRSSWSVNIKERRDYSTAVFDADGRCLVTGDHMPVHLGAMPLSMAALRAAVAMGPGDVAILNDPFRGGTHLPDITMARAVFPARSSRPAFHVACRAHHSDVGGMTPGSMALATEIYQEGLRIPPLLYRRSGQVNHTLEALLLANVRTPEERRGDLAAQGASLEVGARRLLELDRKLGPKLRRTLPWLLSYTARATRSLIATIPTGTYLGTDVMDGDGITPGPIELSVTVRRTRHGRLVFDFRDCPPQVAGSINCSRAVTVSAVSYVLRCLLAADVPMNAGTMVDVDVLTTPATLLDARAPAAVCGGNVETSQRIVDLLLAALAPALPDRIPASSQGTMNNLAFGGTRGGRPYAYYETMAGGAGASPSGAGAAAVHTHMTNSLNTPVEVLERLYPARVRSYRVRRGSGGAGRHRGGDGLVREIELLTDTTVTLLSERREHAPPGLAGGGPGRPGRDSILPRGARRPRELPAKVTLTAHTGDLLVVATPGGGGWGRKRSESL